MTADETSWRVDADLQWLWAFVTPRHDGLRDSAGPRAGASGARSSASTMPACCSATAGSRIGSFTHAGTSDLSRAPAAPLSRAACSTIRSSRLSPRSKRSCRPRCATRDRLPRRARCPRTGSPWPAATTSSGSAALLGADAQSPPARAPLATASHRRIRRDLQLSLRPDPRRHQLARRAGPPARRRHAQDVRRRQSHRAAAPTVSKSSPACSARPISAASMPPTCSSTLLTAPTPTVPPSLRDDPCWCTDPLNTDLPTPNSQRCPQLRRTSWELVAEIAGVDCYQSTQSIGASHW